MYQDLDSLLAGAKRSDALLAIPFLEPDVVDPTALRSYLHDHKDLIDGAGTVDDATRWTKCVFYYDYLINRCPSSPRWDRAPSEKKSRRQKVRRARGAR